MSAADAARAAHRAHARRRRARAEGRRRSPALVAFALFLPLIGFKTVQNMRNELELETRFPLLFTHRRDRRRREARSARS